MASAFVYGGQGAPRPTTFSLLRSPRMGVSRPMPTPGFTGMAPTMPMGGGQGFSGVQSQGGARPMNLSPSFGLPAAGPNPAPGGSAWDPNQPFANVPDLQSGIRGTLASGGAAFGPDYLRNILRQRILSTGRNQRRRGDILSRLAGLSPMEQRQAMLEMDQQASGETAGALNQADLQGAQGYQDWLQRLLSGERQGEMGTLNQQADQRFQRSMRPSFGGQLLGSAVGIGTSLLGGRGGGGGGNAPMGSRMGQPGFQYPYA